MEPTGSRVVPTGGWMRITVPSVLYCCDSMQPSPVVCLHTVVSGAVSRLVKLPLGVVGSGAASLASVVSNVWVAAATLSTPESVLPWRPLELPQGWASFWVRSNADNGASSGHGREAVLALTVLMVE